MAFDPRREDYQRLCLRYVQSLSEASTQVVASALMRFGQLYARERDSLPQTDADRAFRLVADATQLIDYELPFASDEESQTIISRGHALLDEALSLDPSCFDAVRMKVAADSPTFEGYYQYLLDEAPRVRTSCEAARDAVTEDDPERGAMARLLAMAPYLRWLATLSSKAVICGRNREALRFAREALELDQADGADVRYTAALALAKLEDDQGLDQLEVGLSSTVRAHDPGNAWTRLARASLAFRQRDYSAARHHLRALVDRYPQAATALAFQRELPDGVFARLAVAPFSEDELILAISEGTVLLQEGRDALGRGSFGTWVMLEAIGLATKDQLMELGDLVTTAAQLQGRPGGTNGGDAQ